MADHDESTSPAAAAAAPGPSPPVPRAPSPHGWRARAWPRVRSWLWTIAIAWLAFMVVQSLRGGTPIEGAAPALVAVDLAGQPLRLADLRGRPVLVYFWATWCGACKLTTPEVDRFARAHPEVSVVAIALDDEVAPVEAALAETPRAFRVARVAAEVARAWQVRSLPTTIALDADGNVVWSRIGVILPFELGLARALRW